MDNELVLYDRIEMIRNIIQKNGEEKFYLSFSGGKDSTILHYLIDKALPGNKIPRVFINTGIEYLKITEFVKQLAEKDDRFIIIAPSKPINKILDQYGYPFKSKEHSTKLHEWQQGNRESKSIKKYLSGSSFQCPKKLLYQFTDNFNIKVSQYCCHKLKKEPVKKWSKINNKPIVITGMRREEGGQRTSLGCILSDKNGNLKKFHPLAVVSDEWEDWLVKQKNIKLCDLYYEPYNFKRTGCVGCPFNMKLQDQLDTMSMFLPLERKRCEVI